MLLPCFCFPKFSQNQRCDHHVWDTLGTPSRAWVRTLYFGSGKRLWLFFGAAQEHSMSMIHIYLIPRSWCHVIGSLHASVAINARASSSPITSKPSGCCP